MSKPSPVRTWRHSLRGLLGDVYRLGGEEGYLNRLEEWVRLARREGMVVLLSWWDSHSDGITWARTYTETFPMMRAVRERLGDDPGVLYEPWNEPHGVSWEQWSAVVGDTLRFWRQELDYSGVLVIDTVKWSWAFDPRFARRVQATDAALLGSSQVVFANHRYANDNPCFCARERDQWDREVGRYVGDFPLLGTEYGYWNGPDFEPQPLWNEQLVRHLSDVAVPAGFNGYVAFVWDWIDPNTMVEDAGSGRLTRHGRLAAEFFDRWGDREQ